MRVGTVLWVLAIGLSALAGCIGAGEDDVVLEPARDPLGGFPDPLVIDHDHGDASLHDFVSPTMEVLAQTRFEGLAVPTPAFGEADLLGEDHMVVSALLNGFYIVDISDRAAPRGVSYFPMPGFIADVKASESGDFVFLGVQLAGFTGVQAYNVMVREAPVPAGVFPMAGGCHMIAVHQDHLYCAPNDATVRIFQITETPAAVALTPVAAYAPTGVEPLPVATDETEYPGMTHDMTVQDDPVTGEPVMYVSFWDDGVHAVDVSDPAAPTLLGKWNGESAPAFAPEGLEDDEAFYEGNLHTSMASMVDGRRIIATLPEYAKTPAIYFLDATDYEDIRLVGVWAPKPGPEYDNQHRSFSMHNFQFVQGKVYVGMYHGGAWVVDVSTPGRLAEPVAAGYVVKSGDAGTAAVPMFGGGGPNVWDVLVKDGHIYLSDIGSGLWVAHHQDDPLGDPAWTGFA